MMNNTYVRKNSRFRESLDAIREYMFDDRGNVRDKDFWFTIFPLPEINDHALTKKVEKQ